MALMEMTKDYLFLLLCFSVASGVEFHLTDMLKWCWAVAWVAKGAEFELDSIKKLSKEYAEAKELALAEAGQTVDIEDAKHFLQSDKLLDDKTDEVVKNGMQLCISNTVLAVYFENSRLY